MGANTRTKKIGAHDQEAFGSKDRLTNLVRSMTIKVLLERSGIVQIRFFRAVQKSHGAGRNDFSQFGDRVFAFIELFEVPPLEFLPLGGIVPVPFAKLRGRGDIRGPVIDLRFRLRQTSRPEPVDEDSMPVGRRWVLVDPFNEDFHRDPLGKAGVRSCNTAFFRSQAGWQDIHKASLQDLTSFRATAGIQGRHTYFSHRSCACDSAVAHTQRKSSKSHPGYLATSLSTS